MTVREAAEALALRELVPPADADRIVEGCYVGDLLSWVMGRAKENDLWITVMGNQNAIAVAKLADISMIVLPEDAALDEAARAQAEANGIPVYVSEEPAYEMAVRISGLLN